jgi:hypothetical protein
MNLDLVPSLACELVERDALRGRCAVGLGSLGWVQEFAAAIASAACFSQGHVGASNPLAIIAATSIPA